MGLVVEDDTFVTKLQYMHFHFPRFSMFKIQRCRTAHTSYAHLQHPHREYIFSTTTRTTAHTTLHHCVTGIVAEFLVVTAPGDFLWWKSHFCCLVVWWAGRSQVHHTHNTHITHRYRGRDLSDTQYHSSAALGPWHVVKCRGLSLSLGRYWRMTDHCHWFWQGVNSNRVLDHWSGFRQDMCMFDFWSCSLFDCSSQYTQINSDN